MHQHLKQFYRRGIAILACMAILFCTVKLSAVTVQAAEHYEINGVTVPLKGYENGSASYGKSNCRAFAGMVYEKIWGTTFTSYRGTSDDMLRNVATGSARAITAENVKKFISAAEVGATIRVTTNISGNDVYGTYLHSQILIQKDAKGFTIYESIDSCVRTKYYTWASYASSYGKYKYFKYIKWPGAPAYGSAAAETPAQEKPAKEPVKEEKPKETEKPKEVVKKDPLPTYTGITVTESFALEEVGKLALAGVKNAQQITAVITNTENGEQQILSLSADVSQELNLEKAGNYTISCVLQNQTGSITTKELSFQVYQNTVTTPAISVTGVLQKSVTIHSALSDAEIYYTIDGSVPTTDSLPYTGAFLISDSVSEVKAIAVKPNYIDSEIAVSEVQQPVLFAWNLQQAMFHYEPFYRLVDLKTAD